MEIKSISIIVYAYEKPNLVIGNTYVSCIFITTNFCISPDLSIVAKTASIVKGLTSGKIECKSFSYV